MASVAERPSIVVSPDGAVMLPETVRDRLGWPAGTKLVIEDTPGGVVLKLAPLFPPTRVEDVAGSLGRYYDGPARSIEEMDAAIVSEARRRARD